MNKYRADLATNHVRMLEAMFSGKPWDKRAIAMAARECGLAGGSASADRCPPADSYWTPERTAASIAIALDRPDSVEVWRTISRNPTLDFTFVREHLNKPWNWNELSKNPTVTIDDFIQNRNRAWSIPELSRNPGIFFEDIMKTRYRDGTGVIWSWSCVSQNPNLKWWHVKDNPNIPWHYDQLSKNKFNRHPIVRARLERLAAEEDVAIAGTAEELGAVLPTVLMMIALEYVF